MTKIDTYGRAKIRLTISTCHKIDNNKSGKINTVLSRNKAINTVT